jgi:hypothetical protein
MEAAEKSAHVLRGVIYRRADFFRDDFDAVFECIPIAKVYFEPKVSDWLIEFPKARNAILSSADVLPMASASTNTGQDRDFLVQARRDVFGTTESEPDKIRDTVKDALNCLETALNPKLRAQKEANAKL